MRHVAAYLLATLGGNQQPSAQDVKKILSSAGIEADDAQLSKLISSLEGKDVNQLIAEGTAKLASVPAGAPAGAASGASAAAAPAKGAEAKKEVKEEKKEESDEDMGFGLFD